MFWPTICGELRGHENYLVKTNRSTLGTFVDLPRGRSTKKSKSPVGDRGVQGPQALTL